MTVSSIEKSKKEIISNFNPSEMEAYVKLLVTNLYDAFLELDEGKALMNSKLLKEATDIYTAAGYSNSLTKELEFRLDKANELLAVTLDKKKNIVEYLLEYMLKIKYDKLLLYNRIIKLFLQEYHISKDECIVSMLKKLVLEFDVSDIKIYIDENNNTASGEVEVYDVILFEMVVNEYNNFTEMVAEVEAL